MTRIPWPYRYALCLLVAFLTSPCAWSQNFTAVTATQIQYINHGLLPKGKLCFSGTDNTSTPINFQPGGGGQVLTQPICVDVLNGVAGSLSVPNGDLTTPANVRYTITILVGSSQLFSCQNVPVTGASFSLDSYACSNTPLPPTGGVVQGPITINGNLTLNGSCVGCGNVVGIWHTGSGAPVATFSDGDFYLNTANGDVYRQASGSWGSPIGNILGGTMTPSLIYHAVALASNNAHNIKGAAGTVTGWMIYNNAGYPVYVKIYNKATTPTPGSDSPQQVIGVEAGQSSVVNGSGFSYSAGIGIAIVRGVLDADNTSVAANDCVVDIFYQ